MSVNGIKPVDFTTTSTTDLFGAGSIVRTDDGRKAYRWVLAAANLSKDNLVYHSDKKKGIAKAAKGTADSAGVALVAISSGSYGWVQHEGIYPNALTIASSSPTGGSELKPDSTNGQFAIHTAGNPSIATYIGADLTSQTVLPAGTVDLHIPD